MSVQSRMPLKAQIALLAIVIAVATAIAAASLPSVVFQVRDALFEASLSAADRAALREAANTYGPCGPYYQDLRDQFGFEPWRMSYSSRSGASWR